VVWFYLTLNRSFPNFKKTLPKKEVRDAVLIAFMGKRVEGFLMGKGVLM
jgi:hypothetical protein